MTHQPNISEGQIVITNQPPIKKSIFLIRNLTDKTVKICNNPPLLEKYFKTYVLSKFSNIHPTTRIVSYPKCGRTWLRMLLLKYCEYLNLKRHQTFNHFYLNFEPNTRLYFDHHLGSWVPCPKSFTQMKLKPSRFDSQKIVFLFRDPRDVLVSCWYHLTFREKILARPLNNLILDPLIGLPKIVAFYNLWINYLSSREETLFLSYEYLKNDSYHAFSQLLRFQNLAILPEKIHEAIEETSFKKMQSEEQNTQSNPWFSKQNHSGIKGQKVRSGNIGGYQSEFSSDECQTMDTYMHTHLNKYFKNIYLKSNAKS